MNFKSTFLTLSLFALSCQALTSSDVSIELYNQETDEQIVRELISTELAKDIYKEGPIQPVDPEEMMTDINRGRDDSRDTKITTFVIRISDKAVAVAALDIHNEQTKNLKGIAFFVFVPDEKIELLITQSIMEYLKNDPTTIRLFYMILNPKFATKRFSTLFKTGDFKYVEAYFSGYEWFNEHLMKSIIEKDDSIISDMTKHEFYEWLSLDIDFQEKLLQDRLDEWLNRDDEINDEN